MISFPGCKINLGLNITHKLPNGYHAIESVFIPLKLSDILEIIPNPESECSIFEYSGIAIPGNPDNNIIQKAYELLKNNYNLPSIKAHLHKIVPLGAGLGGGSADASAMLCMLNDLFGLGISNSELLNFSGKLGADCPFFIENKSAFVTGIGDQLETIDPGLSGKNVLLIYPNIHVDTAKAFKNIKPKKPAINLAAVIKEYPIAVWKDHITNDFEPFVFKSNPKIGLIKENLYHMGATFASLSGSGSSVYGIFENQIPELPSGFKKYFTYSERL